MWHSETVLSEGSSVETATTPVAPPPSGQRLLAARRSLVTPPQLSRGAALFFGLGWPVMLMVSMAIEPESEPTAGIGTAVGVAMFLAFAITMVKTVMAAGHRSPLTPLRSTWAGVLAVGVTLGCPLSGHHAGIGAWWFTQMALSVAMLAVSVAFLSRSSAAVSR